MLFSLCVSRARCYLKYDDTSTNNRTLKVTLIAIEYQCHTSFDIFFFNTHPRFGGISAPYYPGNPEFLREHNLNLLSESLWQSVMMLITYTHETELHQSHRCIWYRRARGELNRWRQRCDDELQNQSVNTARWLRKNTSCLKRLWPLQWTS